MSVLDIYRAGSKRESTEVSRAQAKVISIGDQIRRKQEELSRAKTPTDFKRINGQLTALMKQRTDAEKSVNNHQQRANDYEKKLREAEQVQQKNADRQQKKSAQELERARKDLERRLADTSASVSDLHQRVISIEDSFMAGVRDAVLADPVPRKHDVFLSHAFPDMEIAKELHAELVGRKLSVWLDDKQIQLGVPLTRTIDRGIASCHVAVILVTEAFLKGRYWTEMEMGAFFSSRRRVIPVLVDVTRDAVAQYSPLLADRVGLSNESEGFDTIAERIAESINRPGADS